MLEIFLELATATDRIGTITAFYGCSDLMTIDGVQKDGTPFHLTYRTDGSDSNADA